MKNKLITGLKVAGVCGLVGLTGFGLAGCGNQTSKVTNTPTQAYEAFQSYDEFKLHATDILELAAAKYYANYDGMAFNRKFTTVNDDGTSSIMQTYLKDDGTLICVIKNKRNQQTYETKVFYGNIKQHQSDSNKYYVYSKVAQQQGEDLVTTEVKNKSIRCLVSGTGAIDPSMDILNVVVNEKGNYVYDVVESDSYNVIYANAEITPDGDFVKFTQSVVRVDNNDNYKQYEATATFEYGVVQYDDVKNAYNQALAEFARA